MRVYVHGNCQAPAIAYLIRQQHADWDIASYEVFSEKIINEIDRYHHYVETADIIICQPVQDGYRDRIDLSSDWVRASAKPSVQFVIFPSLFFDGQLVGCRSTRIPAYGMPYHDALFVHLVVSGVDLPDITKILLADDLYSDAFIEAEITLSLD
jgi:Polysaccharide biosynthesis enzyme WcbI